jgi:hypothetical protein
MSDVSNPEPEAESTFAWSASLPQLDDPFALYVPDFADAVGAHGF